MVFPFVFGELLYDFFSSPVPLKSCQEWMLIARLRIVVSTDVIRGWLTTHDFKQFRFVSGWYLRPGNLPVDSSIQCQVPEVTLRSS